VLAWRAFAKRLFHPRRSIFRLLSGDRESMKQYCRYCIHLAYGNGTWCKEKKTEMSESAIRKANNCKDFEFCELDAITGVTIYKPRKTRTKKNYEQIKMSAESEDTK
jgi:hypothetical protein